MAPRRLLIAALGGEGGGVLSGWIMDAAMKAGLAAQATSVPGVAQRTGATTYYIEMAETAPGQPQPIFALMPVMGDVDVVVASELLEAARMCERGFVTPDRTFLLASTYRLLTNTEKMPKGDGRLDSAALMGMAEAASKGRFLFDADRAARAAGAPANAVLLGALAGLGQLPLNVAHLRSAIEEGGVAVARNLAGFDAGLAAVRGTEAPALASGGAEAGAARASGRRAVPEALRARVEAAPEAARETLRIAVDRLIDYQDGDYARLYLDRLARFSDAPDLLRQVARHLAVRMSFEDIIRVAQLKIRSSRFDKIRSDLGAGPDEVIDIADYFKPGIPELADLLPPSLGRGLLAWSVRRGVRDKWHIGMRVRTRTISGFLRVWLLAKLRPWRRRSLRYAEEQAAIEGWLGLIAEARAISPEFAAQTAELARVVKGYGDTHRRGRDAYDRLVAEVVRPAIAGAAGGGGPPAAQLQAAIAGYLAAP
jgi:indolepyruvate ferredoxin oxidoreductase beta subunit